MLGELMEEYRPKYLALPEEVYSANPDYFAGMPPVWHEWGLYLPELPAVFGEQPGGKAL